ncbi:hypothetical protein RDI58_017720 [Solanum bulbocastanum]|uniref:Uncharacterized protein n=1 Tax=Solanum bulbocastanum TaxID=147425 RepID=A0AAN8TI84_SOLBU
MVKVTCLFNGAPTNFEQWLSLIRWSELVDSLESAKGDVNSSGSGFGVDAPIVGIHRNDEGEKEQWSFGVVWFGDGRLNFYSVKMDVNK